MSPYPTERHPVEVALDLLSRLVSQDPTLIALLEGHPALVDFPPFVTPHRLQVSSSMADDRQDPANADTADLEVEDPHLSEGNPIRASGAWEGLAEAMVVAHSLTAT